jgi:hypothetical protein
VVSLFFSTAHAGNVLAAASTPTFAASTVASMSTKACIRAPSCEDLHIFFFFFFLVNDCNQLVNCELRGANPFVFRANFERRVD